MAEQIILLASDAGEGTENLRQSLAQLWDDLRVINSGDLPALCQAARLTETAVCLIDSDCAGDEALARDLSVLQRFGVKDLYAILDQGPDALTAARETLAAFQFDKTVLSDLSAPKLPTESKILDEGSLPGKEISDLFSAQLLWFDEEAMLPERQYDMHLGGETVVGAITSLRHRLDVQSQAELASRTLERGELGQVQIALELALPFAPFAENRSAGWIDLHDRDSGKLLGVAVIEFALRRASNLTWQEIDVDKSNRAKLKGQRPAVLWFTGLSGAGKSTVANLVEKKLLSEGRHTYILDGDNVRHGLNRDLGFTDQDRVENVRRVAEVSKLFADAGLIVLVSFISPFRSERAMARELMEEGEFLEIFVDTPLSVCEDRDPKGLYKKARAGLIQNFTGIDSDYEAPEDPDIRLLSGEKPADILAEEIVASLRERGIVG